MKVICVALETHRRAGIYFPQGEEIELEVVEDKKDGKLTGNDPPEELGPDGKLRHDARRVGTRSYEAIKADMRISKLEGGAARSKDLPDVPPSTGVPNAPQAPTADEEAHKTKAKSGGK